LPFIDGFLTLHRIVSENIATGLLYPKIEKTVPQFLTIEEYTRLLGHFTDRADSPMGLRNLVIIMLLGTLGLRTATLTALNIEDVDLTCGLLWIREKGRRHRSMVLLEQIDTHTILDIRDYAVYALMYQLGLRVGEVHGLSLQDIDFKKNKAFLAIYLLEVLNLISILV
jgi:site-specific recombinase XerC